MVEVLFQTTNPNAVVPTRATDGSAGFDLYSIESFILLPGVRHSFPIGVRCAIPEGWCGMIWPRSGWAVKYGLDKLAGLIDSDYRGDIHAILINTGGEPLEVRHGDRVAQLVIVPCLTRARHVVNLDATERGSKGFGSSGL